MQMALTNETTVTCRIQRGRDTEVAVQFLPSNSLKRTSRLGVAQQACLGESRRCERKEGSNQT